MALKLCSAWSTAAGGPGRGTWQVTWLYMACLLRNGELYEQLGAWEDGLIAFKEGLVMVSRAPGTFLTSSDILTLCCCSADIICMQTCPAAQSKALGGENT